jgi:hypothetical protein
MIWYKKIFILDFDGGGFVLWWLASLFIVVGVIEGKS